jgi:hypothetical protein
MGSGHSRGHSGTLQRPAKTIVHPFALCLRKTRHLRPGTVASLMPLRSPQGLADAFGLPGGNSHIPGRNVLPVRRLVSIAVRAWLLSVTESFVLPPVTREAPCHKMLSGHRRMRADDGVGFPENFDPSTDGGLGFQLMRALANGLNAELQFEHDSLGVCARLVKQKHFGVVNIESRRRSKGD